MDKTESLPPALSLLHSERPRNVNWSQAAALLFGDWGTSRLYVLGLAFLVAGRSSFWLIAGMSVLILSVSWAYTQICRIYPDGGGVYTAAKQRSRLLAVIGALLLSADYTVTASFSARDAFHYFGLGAHPLDLGTWHQNPLDMWRAFVFVVLALSGVEAIANLTGGMKKPVCATAKKSIWVVAAEVAVFNLLLCLMMVTMAPAREAHVGD